MSSALDSLLAQDFDNLELIISDNASSDQTAEVCQDYAKRDARVRYVRNATNIGPNRNFARVLDSATGTYFMWAAHDDLWSPDYVRRLHALFGASDQISLVAGRTVYVTEEGAPSSVATAHAPPSTIVPAPALVGALLDQHATSWFYGLYRRETLLDLMDLLHAVPVWGGDVMFLMRCCLRYQVVGDDDAIIYKRLRTHSAHHPKTPRAWVEWQRIFVTSILARSVGQTFVAGDLEAMLHVRPYLQRMIFKKGVRRNAIVWIRAAYQLGQGRDHA